MAERLGTSLQNCVQRFKSARDLQKTQHKMCWVFLLEVTEGGDVQEFESVLPLKF